MDIRTKIIKNRQLNNHLVVDADIFQDVAPQDLLVGLVLGVELRYGLELAELDISH
jgi:hypothetical protein